MSSSERYERRLPGLLEDLAAPRMPDYFDDILGQVDRTRQRPGWTFPERWLPMSAVSDRLATMPRFPLRAVFAAALILLALVVALVLYAGSAKRVPSPFGSADNGVIAFVDQDGAIRSGLADATAFKVIVPGPGNERPVFSPDGTKLACVHDGDIVVAAPDGSGGRTLNTDGIVSVAYLGWTPDSGSVVTGSEPGKILAYDLAKPGPPTQITDRARLSGTVSGLTGFHSRLASLFRPPLGDEIAFLGTGSDGDGLYVARRDGSSMRPLVTATTGGLPFVDLGNPEWSPDGSQIAFMARAPGVPEYATIVYLVNADGSGIRRLSPGCQGTETSENFPAWSPDGTRIALLRWCPSGVSDPGVRPITVIDVATGAPREVGDVQANGYVGWEWSPDGTSIVEVPALPVPDGSRLLVVNATSGVVTRTSETTVSQPSWQRTLAAH